MDRDWLTSRRCVFRTDRYFRRTKKPSSIGRYHKRRIGDPRFCQQFQIRGNHFATSDQTGICISVTDTLPNRRTTTAVLNLHRHNLRHRQSRRRNIFVIPKLQDPSLHIHLPTENDKRLTTRKIKQKVPGPKRTDASVRTFRTWYLKAACVMRLLFVG